MSKAIKAAAVKRISKKQVVTTEPVKKYRVEPIYDKGDIPFAIGYYVISPDEKIIFQYPMKQQADVCADLYNAGHPYIDLKIDLFSDKYRYNG